eukprot:gene28311-37242_t
MKTQNLNLQKQLRSWIEQVTLASNYAESSQERLSTIMLFSKSFVPSDVSEDDIQHFSGNLINDIEYFESLRRDLEQCESGYNVESIQGDQRSKAIFTLLPPEGLLSSDSSLDIVREVSFISTDYGETWTAEKVSASATNLSGSNSNAKIMSLTSYIFSGFFQKKSTNDSNELSLAQEYRDSGKVVSSRKVSISDNPASNKHKVQHSIQYQENPNYKSSVEPSTSNVAYRASTNQSNSILSTSKPNGSVSSKNIRSVRVSQSAPTHSKHFISNSQSTTTATATANNSSLQAVSHSSTTLGAQTGKSSYAQSKSSVGVLPSIADSYRSHDTDEYSNHNINLTRKTSGCDGKHETDDCPYYKKKREDHPDAQRNGTHKLGGTSLLPGGLIMRAKVMRQPGDGSCLFHSMSYGLGSGINASRLRSEICTFIQNNPELKISDTPLKDWVRWDSGSSVSEYARTMSRGSWGGGIEMACLSQLKGCNVHVYERSALGFKRISAFDHPDNPQSKPVVRVLYCGGIHYVRGAEWNSVAMLYRVIVFGAPSL